MGWASGSDVFDTVARQVIKEVQGGSLDRDGAVAILVRLIEGLTQADWDTWDESLDEFEKYPLVRDAFIEAGVLEDEPDE